MSAGAIIKNTFILYAKSLLVALPLSVLMVFIVDFFLYGKSWLPPSLKPYEPYHSKVAMVLIVLIFPIAGLLIRKIDNIAMHRNESWLAIMQFVGSRLITLMGSLVSLILIPAIILGFGIAGYLLLEKYQVPRKLLLGWEILVQLTILASLATKILYPFVIVTVDTENPMDFTDRLMKNNFIQTFIFSLILALIVIGIVKVGYILKGMPSEVQFWLPQLLFVLFIPLMLVNYLTQLQDLMANLTPITSSKALSS